MNWVVLGWFCTAQADMLQTPPLESKKDADKILSISKRMLRKEKGIKVKRGRYLVPQKGYRFRVVVEGVNDLERSKKLASRQKEFGKRLSLCQIQAKPRFLIRNLMIFLSFYLLNPLCRKQQKKKNRKKKRDWMLSRRRK